MEHFTCNFDPALFHLTETFAIRWYGLAYLLAFILVFLLVPYQLKKRQISFKKEKITDLLFWIFVSMLLGARLGFFLFYRFDLIFSNPLEILRIWHGGMSFHGGLIGVVISGILLAPRYKFSRLLLADLLILPASLALVFGRLANFLNCEIWGREYSGTFSMIFPRAGLTPRHPAQLYGSFLYFLVFLFLFFFLNKKRLPGTIFFIGLTLLGFARFLNEFFREPDYFVFSWLTIGQLLSIPLIFTGIFGLFYLSRKSK